MIPLLATTRGPKHRFWWLALAVLAVSLAGIGYWYSRPPRPNILLVTFDTTRADRLGAYGYQNGQTGGFDDFARQGIVFEQAYAPAPITLPAHATILTGLYPPEHGLRINGSGRLAAEIPALPEILKHEGYETGAFIAAVVLDSRHGLDRGFDVYDDDIPRSSRHFGELRRDGKDVVDAALNWLRQRGSRPFFCWIHLFDAHAPYDPRPETYGQTFAENPYDAGVAWEVAQFERVMSYLRDQQLDANTLVIVAGDHGEGLGEHQEPEHGMLVYNSTLQVPLAFAGAGCRSGGRVSEAVSLVDVMPTVLDLLRLPAPERLSGRSLLPALSGQPIDSRDCYAEAETPFVLNGWAPLRCVISDGWKYIRTTRPELYDLRSDPGELNNLAESDSAQLEDFEARLAELEQSLVFAAADEAQSSASDIANLQALGYVSGRAPGGDSAAARDDLPDVKDFLPQLARFEEARHTAVEGKPDVAIPILQEIVGSTDQFPAAELLLADCLAQTGRLDEAEAAYRSILSRSPEYVRVHFTLGKVLGAQGRLDDALAEFRAYLAESPDPVGHLEAGHVLVQLERFREAEQEYRRALGLAPDLAAAHMSLGQLQMALGRASEAAASFRQAVRFDPNNVAAHIHLLIVLSQTGEVTQAIQHGEKAVALDPGSFEARFNLGVLLVANRRFADGLAHLRAAQQLRPDDPRPREQIERAEAAMRQSGLRTPIN